MTRYFAHTGRKPDRSDWQELQAHLRAVARLAVSLADAVCGPNTSLTSAAYAAALLHDLGKYREGFQTKLEFESRKLPSPVPRELTFHKQAGAAKAAFAGHAPVAFAIAGHHGGMPNKIDLLSLVRSEGGRPVVAAVWPIAKAEMPELAKLLLSGPPLRDDLQSDLFTRLLFSCLVDADWADTGATTGPSRAFRQSRLCPSSNLTSLERLLEFIRQKAAACRDPIVAQCTHGRSYCMFGRSRLAAWLVFAHCTNGWRENALEPRAGAEARRAPWTTPSYLRSTIPEHPRPERKRHS